MVKPVRKSSNKNPPIFSHEFIIQNHADIVSCIAMIFVVALMIQATSPIASIFIALQHNATAGSVGEIPLYTSGIKDWAGVFFYSLICIVIHAVFQEYVLDKITKKMHFSKSKLAIFTTSGHLSVFYAICTVWGLDIIIRENYLPNIALLWSDYPPNMSFIMKLFFIIQLAYSLHEIPELYFQRVKKEEYFGRASQSIACLILIAIPYFLNFNRLLLCLLVLHYISELVNHVGQIIQTVDRDEKFSKAIRGVTLVALILARLGSIILAVLTLWYGLALEGEKELDLQAGYFNTVPIRLGLLGIILALQVFLTCSLINQVLAKFRENKVYTTVSKAKTQKKDKVKKAKKSAEESDLPEVDQNTNKNLRKQKVK